MKLGFLTFLLTAFLHTHAMEAPDKFYLPLESEREEYFKHTFVDQLKNIVSSKRVHRFEDQYKYVENYPLRSFIETLTHNSILKSYNDKENFKEKGQFFIEDNNLLYFMRFFFYRFKPQPSFKEVGEVMNAKADLLDQLYDAGINIRWYFTIRNFLISKNITLDSQRISPKIQGIIDEELAKESRTSTSVHVHPRRSALTPPAQQQETDSLARKRSRDEQERPLITERPSGERSYKRLRQDRPDSQSYHQGVSQKPSQDNAPLSSEKHPQSLNFTPDRSKDLEKYSINNDEFSWPQSFGGRGTLPPIHEVETQASNTPAWFHQFLEKDDASSDDGEEERPYD